MCLSVSVCGQNTFIQSYPVTFFVPLTTKSVLACVFLVFAHECGACLWLQVGSQEVSESEQQSLKGSTVCQCVTQAVLLHILLHLLQAHQSSHLFLSSVIFYIPPLTLWLLLDSLKVINVEKDIFLVNASKCILSSPLGLSNPDFHFTQPNLEFF